MAQKPINGADAVTIRNWTEAHRAEAEAEAERDELAERESLMSELNAHYAQRRAEGFAVNPIIFDALEAWKATLEAQRAIRSLREVL